mgnify:FL=1
MGAVVDISTRNPVYSSLDGSVVDMSTGVIFETNTARTAAFILATGITDPVIIAALNTFDLGLISNSLDSAMIAMRIFVGGNAIDEAVDFFANRNIAFNGGWTFPNGALGDGTTGYYQSNIVPDTDMTESDYSYGFYFGSGSAANEFIGNYGGGCFFGFYKVGSDIYIYCNTPVDIAPITPSSFVGFHQITKADGSNVKYKHSGESIETRAAVPTVAMCDQEFLFGSGLSTYPEFEVYLDYFTNRALTSGEMATLETLVETLQAAIR